MKYFKLFESFKKLSITINKEGDGFKIFDLLLDNQIIGTIALEGKEENVSWKGWIIDSFIKEEYRNNGYYKEFLFQIVRKRIKINSIFRSPNAERAWKSLIKKLPGDIAYREYLDYDKNVNFEIFLK